jgi:hypothetical protein
VVIALGAAVQAACGHVDPGSDFQVASVVYDKNYFYCAVEPMLFAQRCGPGDSGTDPAGTCHFTIPRFTLTDHEPVRCTGNVPEGPIPREAQQNFQAAASKMSPNADDAPLLLHPTKQSRHPRLIFEADSPEAEVLRNWAENFTSR